MSKEPGTQEEQPGQPEEEPWYQKQLKDPTGMGSEVSKGKLGGCLAGILLIVVVIFAIAGSQ
jgi:hypothetical protein